jgi:hypothetical protein
MLGEGRMADTNQMPYQTARVLLLSAAPLIVSCIRSRSRAESAKDWLQIYARDALSAVLYLVSTCRLFALKASKDHRNGFQISFFKGSFRLARFWLKEKSASWTEDGIELPKMFLAQPC